MPEDWAPHEVLVQVNGFVVLFTFMISVFTGVLFGIAPAFQLVKNDVWDSMRGIGRRLNGRTRGGKIRSLLLLSEVAMTVVLLVGASTAISGFITLVEVRLGYDPANVLTMSIDKPEESYNTWESRNAYFQRILEKLRDSVGVQNVSASINAIPPWITWATKFEVGEHKEPGQRALVGLVSGDYFSTIHIPLIRGRSFSKGEVQRAERVAVINEELVRQYWSEGRDLVGARIHVPELEFVGNSYILTPRSNNQFLQIVGIAATASNQGVREQPRPAIYVPYTLLLPSRCKFLIRTIGNPYKLMNTLREQVSSVDSYQPVTEVMTLEDILNRSERAYSRFSTMLFSMFAAVGLILAAMGIYSTVSYVVELRTHEFGIRIALGARSSQIFRLVFKSTGQLVVAGVIIGLIASSGLNRFIANYIDGWDRKDPTVLFMVPTIVIAVATVACWVPARRATAIQPIVTLRHE